MNAIQRGILAASAIAIAAACNQPNLRSTGWGYAPDTSAAPLAAPAEAAPGAGIEVPPPTADTAAGDQSADPAGAATPR